MRPRDSAILFLRACLGLAVCLLVPPVHSSPANPPPSTTPPSAKRSTFFESVEVRVVNVEVYVTDRDGKRIPGLKREDFELLEDGKPVRISNFYAVDTPAPPSSPSLPMSPTSIPPEQRLYLALFVDERSLTAPARNRLLPAVASFVTGRLRPGDRLLLVRYDGSVKVVGPTTDIAVLQATLARMAREPAHGTEAASERRRLLSDIYQADIQEDDGPLSRSSLALVQAQETYTSIRLFAENRRNEVRGTLNALSQLVDSLAGLPGRKAVLLLSGGLSQHPGEALFQAWQRKFARFSQRIGATSLDASSQDTSRLFERLVEHANSNRITFYSLAAPEDLSGSSAEAAGRDLAGSPGLATTESLDRSQPLGTLAAGTGGLASLSNPGPLLERLRGDFDAYYSLGYVPVHRKDGKNHRLEVRVHAGDLRPANIRTRAAYRERTGEETTAGRMLSALVLGEGSNPFGASFAVESESPIPKDDSIEVTLGVKLPMAKLVLLPTGDAHEGQMRIFFGAKDIQGRISEIGEVTVPVSVPNDQILTVMSQNIATQVTLRMRPGENLLAVGVRDELGNVDSIVTGAYTAGRPPLPK
jgi:VWFA-related protein